METISEIEYNPLDQISQKEKIIFEGWSNGKKGAICDEKGKGIFRFFETYRDKNGRWECCHTDIEDNPIVCAGITGWWINRRKSGINLLINLMEGGTHNTDTFRQMCDKYTDMRFLQYKERLSDDVKTWNWTDDDWKRNFYCDYIIPHETKLNTMTELLFEFISECDVKKVRDIMDCYMEYLERYKEEWMPAPTNIFDYRLDENAILNTIKHTYNIYNKTGLGEINFTYAIHNFFESINWLSDVRDTKFVSWMKYYKLMTVKAINLKQARKEDNRVISLIKELHSIFQTKHPSKERWIDKNEYYLEEFVHSKINDGNS